MNTTQAQQKALDDALVAPADRLEFGKYNMRLKTDIKPKEATFQVVLDALALTPFYCAFLITADVPAIYMQEFWATFCPKTARQKFEDLPLEHDILSFIRDLGHTGDVTYLTNVNVDYLHQPWRAFSTVINKCLSGKETGMDKIRLSRAQILWDAKKTNKMSYPRFTKIIIDYFMSKDQSISRRNKMFWHTARDDTMLTSMRCISKHKYTQVYGTILPKELTNQAMLESNTYKTYYAFAFGEKTPKPKYVRKKVDFDTSPKQNPVQATKGTRIKSKAKVSKSDKKKQPAKKPKDKGLVVLSEVALTEAEQLKLATKRSKKDFHISHASGSEEEECDDEFNIEKEEKINDEESMDEEEDNEATKELYNDVNVNLGNEDTDMTNADQGPTQISYVSSDFTSKLLNLDNPSLADNEIASLMDTTAQHATAIPEITSSFTTNVLAPPPFFNPLLPQETPTALDTTTSLPALPDFASVFKFNEKSPLASKLICQKIKQVNLYAQALSSIPAIVDCYMNNKLGEAINKAILAHNLDNRQEAQDEKNAYIELVDTSMRALIKEEVNTQLPQILPQAVSNFANLVIDKNVIESVEVAVLTRSSS
ncbi:hypothetical protein Tco_0986871 [Tanacetum coccineum]